LNKLYKFSKGEPFARADTLNKLALSWLKQNPEKFFMWLHYMDVHTPYVPKKEYLKMFSSSSHNILTDLSLYFKLKKNISKKSADITKDDLKLLVDSYDAEIRYTDTQIGLLLNELGNMGLLEKTLIIITSDHGEGFFEHGVFGHFSEHLYDELIRVPLIIYAPGIGENIIVDEQVELLSIAPTINETLTNTEMDVFMGRSLFPIIRGEKEGTKGVISEASRTRIAYRESDWKFLLDKKTNKIEIYHLKDDPQEKNNIAQLQPEKVKEFRQKILDHECMTERKMMKRRIKKLKTLKKV
jgi:arylsulfatase A-like enzyme